VSGKHHSLLNEAKLVTRNMRKREKEQTLALSLAFCSWLIVFAIKREFVIVI
jgi:hypothetical protein